MALHRDHVGIGHGAIDECEVTRTEFVAMHSVALKSADNGLLEVPDQRVLVPTPRYRSPSAT
jgi:hypothetical protein